MTARLKDLIQGTAVKGVVPHETVVVVGAEWFGSTVELTYRTASGQLGSRLLFREHEEDLEIVEPGRAWSFDADGATFRLASEAHRVRLGYLFDPHLAVSTSLVDPLPHQITAVYEEMLPRQPLRFLLADDPGAGKTIMAGLLIKELMVRGDVRRCMVICPGALVEQWQDELWTRFHLPFEILTNDKLEAAHTGNWFKESDLILCRLDKLARDENAQEKLRKTDWDLVICDEAHKMSATVFGQEVKRTKRHQLGQTVSGLTRHFLLMTATPHNGKEEDFQLFLSLLDGDRFAGRYRDGVHTADASDLMRRMVKEKLVKFDGRPLFPERRAYTLNYKLTPAEAELYTSVTQYVREEFNRADQLEGDGRKGTVGFALTVLQRRLASSPEAIYRSVQRRRERLESRLREERLFARGAGAPLTASTSPPLTLHDDWPDEDELPGDELEELEEEFVDQATAARTIEELEAEIETLTKLERQASRVLSVGNDRKWEQLSELLQSESMFAAEGRRRKLVIFTEHRDTLTYLVRRIRTLLGQEESVRVIHGSISREDRKHAEVAFKNDPNVHILVATDAAGEGINLQRAHLMVNYDLPWNPNRLEQRFGRIHRIGQEEVCHLWNLVAEETREGDVYLRLLQKLEVERESLGGAVFDVLGQVFQGPELRRLFVDAIRYGDDPEVRARLQQVVDQGLDHERLRDLIEGQALAPDSMDVAKLQRVREEMERAELRRLQPHFIQTFFEEAFKRLGGRMYSREFNRFEITNVPAEVRHRDRIIGTREAVAQRYERVTFKKESVQLAGHPIAEFIAPGHPLMDAVVDLTLERHRSLLRRGAVLVDPSDESERVRVLFYLEHGVQDGRTDRQGNHRTISKELQFVEIDASGSLQSAGGAPFLDYEPVADDDMETVETILEESWLRDDLEPRVRTHAVEHEVPRHLNAVRARVEERVAKTRKAVHERLTKEINYWDHRANELELQVEAGRQPRMNPQRARERAEELAQRLQARMKELDEELQITSSAPTILGGALVVPHGLLARLRAHDPEPPEFTADAAARRRVEMAAMEAVLASERALGCEPIDVSADNRGYDIESKDQRTGRLRFLEVKGRVEGASTVTVSRNEILGSFNSPDQWILAMVEVQDGVQPERLPVRYVRRPFTHEPGFAVASVNFRWKDFWERGNSPAADSLGNTTHEQILTPRYTDGVQADCTGPDSPE